jgi:hypothetical protein
MREIQKKIMSEMDVQKQNRAKSLAVICACAIIGAIGGGILSMLMLIIFWGYYESSTFGILIGFPVGLILGGGSSLSLMRKQTPIMKVFIVSIFLAFLVSCIFTAIIVSII